MSDLDLAIREELDKLTVINIAAINDIALKLSYEFGVNSVWLRKQIYTYISYPTRRVMK